MCRSKCVEQLQLKCKATLLFKVSFQKRQVALLWSKDVSIVFKQKTVSTFVRRKLHQCFSMLHLSNRHERFKNMYLFCLHHKRTRLKRYNLNPPRVCITQSLSCTVESVYIIPSPRLACQRSLLFHYLSLNAFLWALYSAKATMATILGLTLDTASWLEWCLYPWGEAMPASRRPYLLA